MPEETEDKADGNTNDCAGRLQGLERVDALVYLILGMVGTEWCLTAFLLPSFENAFRPFNEVTDDSSQSDEEIQNPEAP